MNYFGQILLPEAASSQLSNNALLACSQNDPMICLTTGSESIMQSSKSAFVNYPIKSS